MAIGDDAPIAAFSSDTMLTGSLLTVARLTIHPNRSIQNSYAPNILNSSINNSSLDLRLAHDLVIGVNPAQNIKLLTNAASFGWGVME
jgi:hypothetical protein